MRCSTLVKTKDFRQLADTSEKDMMWHQFILFHYFCGETAKLKESKMEELTGVSWETL